MAENPFPRPPHGHMPSPQGDRKPIGNSDAAFTPGPGKETSGTSMAERKRGYTGGSAIGSAAKSDPLSPSKGS